MDDVNMSTCTCASGYTGTICETDIIECASNPCENGGTSDENEANMFTCDCASGYTGITCETDVMECNSSPCENVKHPQMV